MDRDQAVSKAINLGTGRQSTVLDMATTLAELLDVDIEPEIVGRFRAGDIRHCYADISLAREVLGFQPEIDLRDGASGSRGLAKVTGAHPTR